MIQKQKTSSNDNNNNENQTTNKITLKIIAQATIQILPKIILKNDKKLVSTITVTKNKTAAQNNKYSYSNTRNSWLRKEMWCSSYYYTINFNFMLVFYSEILKV